MQENNQASTYQKNQAEKTEALDSQLTAITAQMMNFGQALAILKRGGAVHRTGWSGEGLWLCLQTPDENSKMTLPYVYLCYPQEGAKTAGARVPWAPSQIDLLADDWQLTIDSIVGHIVELQAAA